ncbi:MAG TPA: DUF3995 domain-containing protein [Ornithinimicrobium sp.]|uniref:DUF3995 domain-containing protein n=1 Tax=Ornithinimicrobium sp. TaxID=1977084 RepID=UPI002B47128C|nr:DUF3995 domain-containing protein [Ornithinimicrobium sp.]HKJ10749.1 DUF3995 domain-containing protein [Ornithinimicrobium sp.]
MTIRQSTGTRAAATAIAAGGLAGAAAVHALWASGSTWPAEDYDDLADLVVGRGPFPSRPVTAVVAGLLTTASVLVVLAGTPSAAQSRIVRAGSTTVAIVLLVRGVGGLGWEAVGVGQASEAFRFWDRRLYSPLCISLGVCATLGRRGRRCPVSWRYPV